MLSPWSSSMTSPRPEGRPRPLSGEGSGGAPARSIVAVTRTASGGGGRPRAEGPARQPRSRRPRLGVRHRGPVGHARVLAQVVSVPLDLHVRPRLVVVGRVLVLVEVHDPGVLDP